MNDLENINLNVILVGKKGDLEHYAMVARDQIIFKDYNIRGENYENFVKEIIKDFTFVYCARRKIGINQLRVVNGYKVIEDGRPKLIRVDSLNSIKTFQEKIATSINQKLNGTGWTIIPNEHNN